MSVQSPRANSLEQLYYGRRGRAASARRSLHRESADQQREMYRRQLRRHGTNGRAELADLRHLLAKYPAVSVDAAAAKNMTVDAALSWTSSASLALTASGSLIVNKPVIVAGSGSVAIQTADSGLSFAPKASLSFWDLFSALTINKVAYTLVGDIK